MVSVSSAGQNPSHRGGADVRPNLLSVSHFLSFPLPYKIVIHGHQIKICIFPTTVYCTRVHTICLERQNHRTMQKHKILFLIHAHRPALQKLSCHSLHEPVHNSVSLLQLCKSWTSNLDLRCVAVTLKKTTKSSKNIVTLKMIFQYLNISFIK